MPDNIEIIKNTCFWEAFVDKLQEKPFISQHILHSTVNQFHVLCSHDDILTDTWCWCYLNTWHLVLVFITLSSILKLTGNPGLVHQQKR